MKILADEGLNGNLINALREEERLCNRMKALVYLYTMDSYSQQLNLSKLKRCNQYFSEMEEVDGSKICAKCSHKIHDFRNKSAIEIAITHATTEGKVCGVYPAVFVKEPRFTFIKKRLKGLRQILFTVSGVLLQQQATAEKPMLQSRIENLHLADKGSTNLTFQSQEQKVDVIDSISIRGRIMYLFEDTSFIAPGVAVVIKGTAVGCVSDSSGYYNLVIPEDLVEGDSLTVIYSYVGFATQDHTISRIDQKLDVLLLRDTEMTGFIVIGYPLPLHKRVWYWFKRTFM